jgi:hypothetical protein
MSELVVETSAYRLELTSNGLFADLSTPGGELLARLRPHAAVDTVAAPDETLAIDAPTEIVAESNYLASFAVARRSTVWERAGVTVLCGEESVELRPWVAGREAQVTDVHLLGFRSLLPGGPLGFLPSGSRFRSLFSPNPGDPTKVVRSAAEPAVVGVSGDGTPGRGHWLFTPAPLFLALTTAASADPHAELEAGWLGLALAAPVDVLAFVQLTYVPAQGAFHLALDYEGHTDVDGELELPALVLTPGLPDPYEGLRRNRVELSARGFAPPPEPRATPDWWHEPIFCGWGAQCHLARGTGRFAGELATQANYDAFLDHLEANGVRPGTIVLDDKWQDAYGTNRPDPAKWPDLGVWIAERHERGQRVLLWWKAWDPEGLPPELCIRNPDGRSVAFDPTNPEARELVRATMLHLLAPDGLDADGLKVDFTARTPSGRALTAHGGGWGIALLHDLLALLYAAAKEAKPDALVMTHTPHPSFAGVTDMIRLNDMVWTDDPAPSGRIVPQMRHRAEVARAATPELLIDTDDWPVPCLAVWREYVEAKPLLGVPSLYYARAVDATGEELEEPDYEALRSTWAAWRDAHARSLS